MPELPDVNLYVVRLSERLVGQTLSDFKIYSPFVLRSATVPKQELVGKKLLAISRLGKRLLFHFEQELFLVVHLMIAGRFVWTDPPLEPKRSKIDLCRMDWTSGILTLNEASPKKRAGIWIVRGGEGLISHSRTGIDVFVASPAEFASQLRSVNRTVKRALTDPNSFDGIGNAFSDEILFEAKLSPLKLTGSMTDSEVEQLYEACRTILRFWMDKLLADIPKFPKPSQVTAFRKEFHVHGKFEKPCDVCGSPVQRVVASENEMNYCARCQNGGKMLADRSLSRLLKDDWPKTVDELMAD